MDRERLIQAGIDYDAGLKRFAGKPQLYEKYLLKLLGDETLKSVRRHIEHKNYPLAFDESHSLKGLYGNLSLGELYDTMCELVEELRTMVPGVKMGELLTQAERKLEEIKTAIIESQNI